MLLAVLLLPRSGRELLVRHDDCDVLAFKRDGIRGAEKSLLASATARPGQHALPRVGECMVAMEGCSRRGSRRIAGKNWIYGAAIS